MFDFDEKSPLGGDPIELVLPKHGSSDWTVSGRAGGSAKRVFDIAVSLLVLLPIMGVAAIGLVLLNPFLNRGSLFFVQQRMGRDCVPFRAWKFRSMVDVPAGDAGSATAARGAFDPLDSHRITRLGRFLRKSRIDELPQVINVLRGEMSLIGPRPDAYAYAVIYVETVPGYKARCAALPGITGLAQTEVGYVDGREGVERKVAADLAYLRQASMRLDLWITWRTICTVMGRQGI